MSLARPSQEQKEALMPFEKKFFETIIDSATLEIFYDPVVIDCGHSHERESIDGLIGDKHCPVCRVAITPAKINSNHTLKTLIGDFLTIHPSYRQDQYVPQKLLLGYLENNKIDEIIQILKSHPHFFKQSLDSRKASILHLACEKNNLALVKELTKLEGFDANIRTEILWTPLHYALSKPETDIEIIKLLLENKSDPNAKARCGGTPLHTAIAHKAPLNTLKILLSVGLERNTRITNQEKYNGYTPFRTAIEFSHFEALNLLMTHSPDFTIDLIIANEQEEQTIKILNKFNDNVKIIFTANFIVKSDVNNLKLLTEAFPNLPFHKKCFYADPLLHHCIKDLKDTPRKVEIIKLMLANINSLSGADLDQHGSLLLHLAAEHITSSELFQILFDAKPGSFEQIAINKKYNNMSPLSVAIRFNNTEGVRALLNKGVNCNEILFDWIKNDTKSEIKALLLNHAILIGQLTLAKSLVLLDAKIDFDKKYSSGCTLIHQVIKKDFPDDIRIELIELIINQGADLNLPDDTGSTPLHHVAACRKISPLVMDTLLASGADSNAKLPNDHKYHPGWTPLDIAVNTEHNAAVKSLLNKKSNSQTAFRLAIEYNNVFAVKELLKSGVNPNETNKKGQTWLYQALRKKDIKLEIIALLIEFGADPSIPDEKGLSPLHLAASLKTMPTLLALFKKTKININMNAPTSYKKCNGWTVFDLAIHNSNTEAVFTLSEIDVTYLFKPNSQGEIPINAIKLRPPLYQAFLNHLKSSPRSLMLFLYYHDFTNLKLSDEIIKNLVGKFGDGKPTLAHSIIDECKRMCIALSPEEKNLGFIILKCITNHNQTNLNTFFRIKASEGLITLPGGNGRGNKGSAIQIACDYYETCKEVKLTTNTNLTFSNTNLLQSAADTNTATLTNKKLG